MQLLKILKIIPLRNETGVIYKWQEELNFMSPMQVQRARFEPNLQKVVVHLTNGEQVIIDENLEEFNRVFSAATA